MPDLDITQHDDFVVLTVKVVPGSSRTAMAGTLDTVLKVKVAAPPEKGKANQALTDFFAKTFGLKKKQVSVISGKASTIKQLRIESVLLNDVEQKIAEMLLQKV